MKTECALRLNKLTERFYAEVASSFDATRQAPWPGWTQVLEITGIQDKVKPSVLDIAAGNARFARFLAEHVPETAIHYTALDSSEALLTHALHLTSQMCVETHEIDLIQGLFEADFSLPVVSSSQDLTVCFGFIHHVPTQQARERLLAHMIDTLKPGGYAVLSLWRFMENAKLAKKAQTTTAMALDALGMRAEELETGDYLLGWQDRHDVWRYCHSFSTAEINTLQAQVGDQARLVAQFESDGRNGKLNTYLIFQRRS